MTETNDVKTLAEKAANIKYVKRATLIDELQDVIEFDTIPICIGKADQLKNTFLKVRTIFEKLAELDEKPTDKDQRYLFTTKKN